MRTDSSVLLHLLRRWFSTEQVEVPEAQHLDIILYSREQLVKEYAAMPSKGDGEHLPNVPWGIISVKVRRCCVGLIGVGPGRGCGDESVASIWLQQHANDGWGTTADDDMRQCKSSCILFQDAACSLHDVRPVQLSMRRLRFAGSGRVLRNSDAANHHAAKRAWQGRGWQRRPLEQGGV